MTYMTEGPSAEQTLASALFRGTVFSGTLEAFTAEIAQRFGAGVVVTTPEGRERVATMTVDHLARLHEHDLIDPTGRIRVEWLTAPVPMEKGWIRSLPMGSETEDLGRLVCLLPGDLASEDLAWAAELAGLLATRDDARIALRNKHESDFLRDLLLHRTGDHLGTVTEHAAAFGWRLDRPVVVISAELEGAPSGVSRQTRRHWQERFAAAWRQVAGEGVPTVDFSSEVVTLLPTVDEAAVRRSVAEVDTALVGARRPFSVGVSRVAASPAGLADAYAQARRSLELGRKLHGGGTTTFFDGLGLHRLLALIPDQHEVDAFAHDVLGALAEDTRDAHDLRETLHVLLESKFDIAEAARRQFLHYNTMRFRLGKLERMLGPISTDAHLRLDVAVALRILDD